MATAYTPASTVSNSFVIGNFTVTAATITVEGTTYFGFNTDLDPDLGAVSPSTFLGQNILILCTTGTSLFTTAFQVNGLIDQDSFATISANGKTFASDDVTLFSQAGGKTSWTWQGMGESYALFTATGTIGVQID